MTGPASHEEKLIPIKSEFAAHAVTNPQSYKEMNQQIALDPDKFWAQQAEQLHWYKKWDQVKEVSFLKPVSIKWYLGGQLNVAYNCIDRHLPKHKDRIAIIWEADEPQVPSRRISYQELSNEVSLMANVLKKHGVKKGTVSLSTCR